MIEAKKASFKFEKFKIPSFSYNESKNNSGSLKIVFNPSGYYNPIIGEFDLTLEFIGSDENGKNVITVTSIATFKFEDNTPLSDLPDYFYINAIAILFPYMRSFISTLTLQSNTGILTLGLMNLSQLELPLRANTKVASETN